MKKPFTLGFAGCGEVGVEKHMPAIADIPEIEVVAVADRNPARLRIVEERFGVKHAYQEVAELLAHPGLDGVALCLPPAFQFGAAVAALDAGKHVWIDPPPGLSLEECDKLIHRAASSSVTVMMGFHMRWHRLVQQARDIVRSGRLGTIQTIRGVWNSPRDENTEPEWRRHRDLGGGALVENAMDHFDLWRYLLETEIEEIFALKVDGRWDDEAAVLSGRMANGVLFSATFSERTSHDCEIEICGKAGRLRVACLRFEGLEYLPKSALLSELGPRLGRLSHFLRELPRALPRMRRAGDYRLSYRRQWLHFLACTRHTATVESTLDDARRALAVTLAALESVRVARPVAVQVPAISAGARR
jgi:myo-inositol 2-dehydrogenase/D-chiro-inositol 1-dehydrogenase